MTKTRSESRSEKEHLSLTNIILLIFILAAVLKVISLESFTDSLTKCVELIASPIDRYEWADKALSYALVVGVVLMLLSIPFLAHKVLNREPFWPLFQ